MVKAAALVLGVRAASRPSLARVLFDRVPSQNLRDAVEQRFRQHGTAAPGLPPGATRPPDPRRAQQQETDVLLPVVEGFLAP